ncbi:MAG: ABC transporter ATP-binding protein [Lachnospiraceae bacterium]|nr:ABC transporter ATP-binding protein [uncultured Acetatifactor sp.]MCI9570791.1 ABC transporter ATP-binding protein [Lachnospiraceae bacterium]NBJ81687.1 ABC transporter ATP-binding protein [bacterium 1XD42-76]NBK05131.1 ABC transporter ATP-binding protein [bacterium 1XD42-94]
MAAPLLEIRNVKKYFPVKKVRNGEDIVVKAVDQIDLMVEQGEIVGLVGESGCGKSTLGKTILKLHDITDGQILFHGEDITRYSESQMRPLREKMQIIFQDPYASLNPKKKVVQSVMAPLNVVGRDSKEERLEKVKAILNEVGLNEKFLEKFPHEMSGGQRQRVVIARALINNPELVICDEPVSALDVSVRSQVLNLLKDLQRDRNLTYIFISHDLSVVEYLCDKVAVMYLGRIMEFADKKHLYGNPLHPYTRALLSAIPVPDIHAEKDEIILQGEVPSPLHPPKGCLFSTRCPNASERCHKEAPALKEITDRDGTKRNVACFLHT